jgi:hypothetical protein
MKRGPESHAWLFNTICDNYLIGDRGVVERLHKLPETLIELR